MDDTILIIANGPSALKVECGDMIDRFAEIARINNYRLSGYNNFIGTKTTIWFNGANRRLKKRLAKIPKKIIVSIPYQLHVKKKDDIIKRTPKRIGLKPSQYELISKKKMRRYEIISNIIRPSTGLNCILWALENYKNVVIHGFDFFVYSRHHYYDSYFLKKILDMGLTNRGKKHDNLAEKKFVDELIKNKKIYHLLDFVTMNNNVFY